MLAALATIALSTGQTPGPTHPNLGRTSGDSLLIIAPRRFRAELGVYVAHKRRQMRVVLADLETALEAQTQVDDAEKLKRYLFSQWKRGLAQYVLLVGDADVLPVRYMVLDRITEPAFDYAFYPSDLYYADLAKRDGSFEDWNARKESFHARYFGEVRGEKNKGGPINFDEVDYRPEIAVGRWPVSSEAQVRDVAAKSVAYERGVMSGGAKGLRQAAMVGVDGWVDCRPMMNAMASGLPEGWTALKRFGPDIASHTPKPTGSEVVKLLNEGLSLVFHTGHGWDDGWEKSLSSNDLSKLQNGACLPVVFSAGCSTGRFATLPPYEPYMDADGLEHKGTNHGEVFRSPPPPPSPYALGRHNHTGLGEKLVRLPGAGSVAYIGCNTGSQPAALTLMAEFAGALKGRSNPRLGDLWRVAVTRFYEVEGLNRLRPSESWYPPSIFFQAMKFMVFGDPSLVIP